MNLQELAVSYENLDLLASQVVEGFITGLHKSPFHGFSVEFAEHRLYNTGESTKNIDWKLYGRADKLFVKRFDEETNLRCHILMDVSSSMYYPAESNIKIKFAALAAAVLANLMRHQRDAVSLTCFNDQVVSQTDVKSSTSHYRTIIMHLQKVLMESPKSSSTDVSIVINGIAEQIHRRSLVVILSDMFENTENNDALFSALQHLKFRKHEVIVFHITDGETEGKFNFDNRPYKFVDSESGDELKLYPDDVRDIYLKRMAKFTNELKLKCNQYRIDFVDADARKSFDQILLPFFAKRNKMR
jgi:uncharacterized protein (DUF58 family)